MLRGRREYYILLVFFCLFLHLHPPLHAVELKMTATVLLSPVWQKIIEENTQVSVDLTHQNLIVTSLRLKPIETASLKDQTIQVLFFYNDQLINKQEKTITPTEKSDFLFVYSKSGNYRLLFINKTYKNPFSLRTVSFTL